MTDLFLIFYVFIYFLLEFLTIDTTHHTNQRSKLHQSKGLTEGLISPTLSVIIWVLQHKFLCLIALSDYSVGSPSMAVYRHSVFALLAEISTLKKLQHTQMKDIHGHTHTHCSTGPWLYSFFLRLGESIFHDSIRIRRQSLTESEQTDPKTVEKRKECLKSNCEKLFSWQLQLKLSNLVLTGPG